MPKAAGFNFQITPQQFDTSHYALGLFGKAEAEWAARIVVVICQRKGGWCRFSFDDFKQAWIELNPLQSFNREDTAKWMLWCLIDPAIEDRMYGSLPTDPNFVSDNLVEYPNGTYEVTENFIVKCLKERTFEK